MKNESLIILDLETTRNSLTNKEEIIEIACIKINEKFEILDKFHTLVKPSCQLSYITKIKTGINDKDLFDKQKINEIIPPLLGFIKDNRIIAHNAKFDYEILKKTFKKHNFFFKNNFIDSLSLLKTIFPNEKCGLASLKEKFNIHKNHHRALDDVHSLKEVLFYSNKIYREKFSNSLLDNLDKFKVNSDAQIKLDF